MGIQKRGAKKSSRKKRTPKAEQNESNELTFDEDRQSLLFQKLAELEMKVKMNAPIDLVKLKKWTREGDISNVTGDTLKWILYMRKKKVWYWFDRIFEVVDAYRWEEARL